VHPVLATKVTKIFAMTAHSCECLPLHHRYKTHIVVPLTFDAQCAVRHRSPVIHLRELPGPRFYRLPLGQDDTSCYVLFLSNKNRLTSSR